MHAGGDDRHNSIGSKYALSGSFRPIGHELRSVGQKSFDCHGNTTMLVSFLSLACMFSGVVSHGVFCDIFIRSRYALCESFRPIALELRSVGQIWFD